MSEFYGVLHTESPFERKSNGERQWAAAGRIARLKTPNTLTAMRVGQDVLDAIAAHARQASPQECCGLLIGTSDRIGEAVPTRNAAADPVRRYEISPVDYFAQIRRCRAMASESALAVIGVYHSHPYGPPEPSATDLANAFEGFLFVIAGRVGAADRWAIQAYTLSEGNLRPVRLVPEGQEAAP